MCRGKPITEKGLQKALKRICNEGKPEILNCNKCEMMGFLGSSLFWIYGGLYCRECILYYQERLILRFKK